MPAHLYGRVLAMSYQSRLEREPRANALAWTGMRKADHGIDGYSEPTGHTPRDVRIESEIVGCAGPSTLAIIKDATEA